MTSLIRHISPFATSYSLRSPLQVDIRVQISHYRGRLVSSCWNRSRASLVAYRTPAARVPLVSRLGQTENTPSSCINCASYGVILKALLQDCAFHAGQAFSNGMWRYAWFCGQWRAVRGVRCNPRSRAAVR